VVQPIVVEKKKGKSSLPQDAIVGGMVIKHI
jgi:hypothetical protein